MSEATTISKELVGRLVGGKLGRDELTRLRSLDPKDPDRFRTTVEVLQDQVSFKEKILLRISDHLFIVARNGERVVKCDCGHEYGDYRINWKLNALIRVRASTKELVEVYGSEELAPDEGWIEIREFYCPNCTALLTIEVVPPGYPLVHEMLPDLDAFYRGWLNTALPDERDDWFEDRTITVLSAWGAESAQTPPS